MDRTKKRIIDEVLQCRENGKEVPKYFSEMLDRPCYLIINRLFPGIQKREFRFRTIDQL